MVTDQMLALALWAMNDAGPKVVRLLGNGVATALKALFASEPKLVSRREGLAERDRVGILRFGCLAIGERFLIGF